MKRLLMLLFLIGCAGTTVTNTVPCPERYTSDCMIISPQYGAGGSQIYTCEDADECRQVIFVQGNTNCEDGLYIVDRWDRNEDGTCEPENPATDQYSEIWEPQDFPQYTIPDVVRDDIESYGYTILGGFVNDDGNVLVFADRSVGDCISLAYIAGMPNVLVMTCDEGMQIYSEVCVSGEFCQDDPYDKTEGI